MRLLAGFSCCVTQEVVSLPWCRGALYECITKEKPTALPTYLLLYCIKQASWCCRLHQISAHYLLPVQRNLSGRSHAPILQGLADGVSASAAPSQLWGRLPPAVPLHSLALGLAYYDGALGLAGTVAHAAALQQGTGGHGLSLIDCTQEDSLCSRPTCCDPSNMCLLHMQVVSQLQNSGSRLSARCCCRPVGSSWRRRGLTAGPSAAKPCATT